MTVDPQDLELTLSLIKTDESGPYLQSRFNDYFTITFLEAAQTKKWWLCNHVRYATDSLNDILAILERMTLQKKMRAEGEIDAMTFMRFTNVDIDAFYFKLRSALDYLAVILVSNSRIPGEVNTRSFHDLRKWVKEGSKNDKIGKELAEVVGSCDWFDTFVEIRDLIVHRGGITLSYPTPDRILFQIYESRDTIEKKLFEPPLMYNDNIVDFEPYAALYASRVFALLEKVMEIIFKLKGLKATQTSKNYKPGLMTLRTWIDDLLRKIDGASAVG